MMRICVRSLFDHSLENSLKTELSRYGDIEYLKVHRVFWLVEQGSHILESIQDLEKVFVDPISEEAIIGFPEFSEDRHYAEIVFKPGVTDNLGRSGTEALMLLANADKALSWQDFPISVHSGWQIEFSGEIGKDHFYKVLYQNLANSLLHKISFFSGAELKKENSWKDFQKYWLIQEGGEKNLELIPLEEAALEKINRERGLALSKAEIQTIIEHYKVENSQRNKLGWQGFITEVELECLAQTWSEHCKHKIFAANIEYSEVEGEFPAIGKKDITSLYKTYIQKSTQELMDCGYLVSVFKDNGGIVDFDRNLNICVKVETHNSPSALDPYGGAITGILGVNRDILGCGIGAKPIANMDVFCLSEKRLFPSEDSPQRPELLKDPAVIFRGVHKGVEDGGNQSGIPTINGNLRFDSEFAAKPLVFVGSVGIMPKSVQGRASHEKEIAAGDLIVVAGGRLGKDGVHGATFSSLALQDNVAPNVVQIGDPITQKRVLDFTLLARDRGWIRAITDNGAGGVSSSVGEMAQFSNGARMDLSLHPVKYPGLEFWEMLISESQERMSYAVSPQNINNFLALAKDMGVEASVLGTFTDTGFFEVHYGEKELARLDLDFLHNGLEKMTLKAHFEGPKDYSAYHREVPKAVSSESNISGTLKTLLKSPNIASREFMVRSYDHEVQGATRLKPFTGTRQCTPNDAGVIDLFVHGGEENNSLVLANGLCPQFSYYDTYLMAIKAVDIAVRNVVAVGGSPHRMALVDNFCWPDPLEKSSNPDALHKMSQLVRACEGIYDAAHAFRAPFVSGKDSMKNDFIGKTQSGETIKISVPPTLLVTAIAQNPESHKTVSAEFKKAGDKIYLLGKPTESLYGSVYAAEMEVPLLKPEYPNLEENSLLYKRVYEGIRKNLISSCHSVLEGGFLVTALESCFGNGLGMKLNLEDFKWAQLFSETGSLFLVSVAPEDQQAFEEHFKNDFVFLGETQSSEEVELKFQDKFHTLTLAEAFQPWIAGVQDVYKA